MSLPPFSGDNPEPITRPVRAVPPNDAYREARARLEGTR